MSGTYRHRGIYINETFPNKCERRDAVVPTWLYLPFFLASSFSKHFDNLVPFFSRMAAAAKKQTLQTYWMALLKCLSDNYLNL